MAALTPLAQERAVRPMSMSCQLSRRVVESISGIRPEVQAAIAAAVDHCVTQTDLPLPNKRVVSVPA